VAAVIADAVAALVAIAFDVAPSSSGASESKHLEG
jgi:hypothetical protein